MAVNSVLAPYPSFFDATGAPLENGSIYIGESGFEARSTPKASFFDVALTIPTGTASGAAIRTSGGFPVNQSGSPAMFYVDGDYSISICDRNGVLLYSALSMTLALNVGGSVGPVLWADGTLGAVGGGFVNEPNTGFVRPSATTMQTVIGGALVATQTPTGTDFPQPVSGTGFSTGVLAIAEAKDADLTALAGLAGTGIAVRTAGNTWAQRQITSTDGSVNITNPEGVAGNIDLSVGGAWTTTATTSISSGTSADITIPATATEIVIDVVSLSLTTADDCLLRLLDGGVAKTTGYKSAGLFDATDGANAINGFRIRLGALTRRFTGYIRLKFDNSTNLWWIDGFLTEETVGISWSNPIGFCTNVTTLSGIRLSTIAGSFDGASGTIAATYR